LNSRNKKLGTRPHLVWYIQGLHNKAKETLGCALAQEVSRRPPTEAARVRAQVRSCWIFGGQSGTGAGFLRVLRFTLPILSPSNSPNSSIIQGWYSRPNSGRPTKWTQSHPTPPQKTKKERPLLGGMGKANRQVTPLRLLLIAQTRDQ
jgi:hypothetical protein